MSTATDQCCRAIYALQTGEDIFELLLAFQVVSLIEVPCNRDMVAELRIIVQFWVINIILQEKVPGALADPLKCCCGCFMSADVEDQALHLLIGGCCCAV